MKDQYTATDMASAAAQGFRDGMKLAVDLCGKVYEEEDFPQDEVAMACINAICKTIIVLEVVKSKDIPDLLDKVAGRIYTLDGVEDVTAHFAGEFERHGDKFIRVDVEQMGT